MSLINAAFIKILGHPEPFKRVVRFQKAYPEFWSRAIESVPHGKKTLSCVRPGFEDEFGQLAEELARGGCPGGSFVAAHQLEGQGSVGTMSS